MKWALLAEWDSPWEAELVAVLRDLLEHEVVCVRSPRDLEEADCALLAGSERWGDAFVDANGALGSIRETLLTRAAGGRLVLAIGTGFHVACRLGILPGRLEANPGDAFVCRMVRLRVENVANPWAQRAVVGDVWQMPVRSARGRFELDPAELDQLERDGLVLLRYGSAESPVGRASANPTGAAHGIAAVMGPGRNVLGILPHPENVVDASLIEPQWPGLESGRVLFDSIQDWVETGARHGVVESER